MSKIKILVAVVLSIVMLIGCSTQKKDAETIKFVMSGPKAPPTFPLLRMIETKALGDNVEIDFKIWNGVEELLAIASTSNYGFLAIPVNTAAKLYNKGIDLKLTNVDTWGVMYLSTTDPDCNKWEDLKGKKLYVPFKSAPPDIVTQFFINNKGLEIGKDIEIVYSTPSEIAQMVKADKIKYAMNIEPFITASEMGNDKVRVIFDYMDEWKKVNGDEFSIPNAGIVTNNKFLEKNSELLPVFEKEYQKALKWTLDNPDEAAKLVKKYLGLNDKLIKKAMPTLGLEYKTATDAKKDLEKYYETLLNFKKESIGGKTPDEEFYYNEN